MPAFATTIALAHGSFVLHIEPATGSCISGFWADGVAVLRPLQPATTTTTATTSARQSPTDRVRLSSSYPLVPYSNRIADGQFHWQGQAHTLAANFLPEPHAIHGVGWQRPWQIIESSADSARLLLRHRPESRGEQSNALDDCIAWPFAFDCIQTFALDNQGLRMQLLLTNAESQRSMPAGLGFHPYFVKRPGSELAFTATGRWEMDARSLPTQRLPSPGLTTDCAKLEVDHCFDGCSGSVTLRDSELDIEISSSQPCLVVYTRPDKDFIAIEPVSHVNNALGMAAGDTAAAQALGVKILQPGETVSMHMRINAQPCLNPT